MLLFGKLELAHDVPEHSEEDCQVDLEDAVVQAEGANDAEEKDQRIKVTFSREFNISVSPFLNVWLLSELQLESGSAAGISHPNATMGFESARILFEEVLPAAAIL